MVLESEFIAPIRLEVVGIEDALEQVLMEGQKSPSSKQKLLSLDMPNPVLWKVSSNPFKRRYQNITFRYRIFLGAG